MGQTPDGRLNSDINSSRASLSAGAISTAIFCAVLLLFAHSASAADLALLSNGFTIRHDHHKVMGATTRLYLGIDDSSFTEIPTADITGYEKDLTLFAPPGSPASAPTPFEAARSAPAKRATNLNEVVNDASATYHLDPDLVNSVIHAESGFNAHAISPKGARGLMQLMPGTASQLGVHDAFDPQANVDGGSRYLRELLERYNFDIVKALAAYNAGPQRVEQYRGVPPYRETRAYVARIVHEYNKKKIAQEKLEQQKAAPAKPASIVAKKSATKTPTHAQLASKRAASASDAPSPR
jgi:soluble lytic murein transglycosylase-like protein